GEEEVSRNRDEGRPHGAALISSTLLPDTLTFSSMPSRARYSRTRPDRQFPDWAIQVDGGNMEKSDRADEHGSVSMRAIEMATALAIMALGALVMYDSHRLGASWA